MNLRLFSHVDVEGLGELLDLDRLVQPHLKRAGRMILDQIPLAEIATSYLQKTSDRELRSETRLIDKGLHNFMYVGFIHLMFPNAMILHCEREPINTSSIGRWKNFEKHLDSLRVAVEQNS